MKLPRMANRNCLNIIARCFGLPLPFNPSPQPGERKAVREGKAISIANANRIRRKAG